MKKLFAIIPVFLIIFFSSCQKEPDTIIHKEGDTIIYQGSKITTYTLQSEKFDWDTYDDGERAYSYASFSIPEITAKVIESGAVMCYYLSNNGYDVALPTSITSYDAEYNTYNTNFISFEVKRGTIKVIYEWSYQDVIYVPNSYMDFKLVIIEKV